MRYVCPCMYGRVCKYSTLSTFLMLSTQTRSAGRDGTFRWDAGFSLACFSSPFSNLASPASLTCLTSLTSRRSVLVSCKRAIEQLRN